MSFLNCVVNYHGYYVLSACVLCGCKGIGINRQLSNNFLLVVHKVKSSFLSDVMLFSKVVGKLFYVAHGKNQK